MEDTVEHGFLVLHKGFVRDGGAADPDRACDGGRVVAQVPTRIAAREAPVPHGGAADVPADDRFPAPWRGRRGPGAVAVVFAGDEVLGGDAVGGGAEFRRPQGFGSTHRCGPHHAPSDVVGRLRGTGAEAGPSGSRRVRGPGLGYAPASAACRAGVPPDTTGKYLDRAKRKYTECGRVTHTELDPTCRACAEAPIGRPLPTRCAEARPRKADYAVCAAHNTCGDHARPPDGTRFGVVDTSSRIHPASGFQAMRNKPEALPPSDPLP